VRAGSAFTHGQQQRLARALENAERQTGLCWSLGVGPPEGGSLRAEGERLLAGLAERHPAGAALVLVAPGERQLEILTTPSARRRLADQQCGLAALSMTTSFGVGDLVGGIVNGMRMLSEAAGRSETTVQLGGPRGDAAALD